jgi:cytochrome c oxidase subunit II
MLGVRFVVGGFLLFLLTACSGPQSALAPAGADAERIASLFWWMLGGAGFVWVAVIGVAVYAARVRPGAHAERTANWLIVGGGVVFPTVVLAVLLSYALWLMPRLGPALGVAAVYADGAEAVPTTGVSAAVSSAASAPWPAALSTDPLPGALRIQVSGEQWWWRVRYVPPSGEPFELANELRLPVGDRAVLELVSPDVVHSFWVPSLGGKMDMIPGRVNRTVLAPTKTGVFRGVCAEYCGTAHALMAFEVVVHEPEEFAAWIARQRAPASPASDADAQRGARLFQANGCGACHAVRGTPADGRVGPDLTHVGSRRTLGAGTLRSNTTDFRRWLARTEHVKPGVHMPSFRMLRDAELDALAAYLESLE